MNNMQSGFAKDVPEIVFRVDQLSLKRSLHYHEIPQVLMKFTLLLPHTSFNWFLLSKKKKHLRKIFCKTRSRENAKATTECTSLNRFKMLSTFELNLSEAVMTFAHPLNNVRMLKRLWVLSR